MYHLHINPSEIEQWDFYEYQYTINNLIEHFKKEKERYKEEEDKTLEQYGSMSNYIKGAKAGSIPDSNKYLKNLNQNLNLKSMTPKLSNINIPKKI